MSTTTKFCRTMQGSRPGALPPMHLSTEQSTSPAVNVVAPSSASPCPHSPATKIAPFLGSLRPLESTLLQVLIPNNLNSFRINTYANRGGVGRSPSRKLFPHTNPKDSTCVLIQ